MQKNGCNSFLCVLRMVRAPCEVKCFVPLSCEHPTLRNSHLRYFFPSCINLLSNASSSAWCSSSSLSLPAHIPRTRTLTHLPAANLHVARTIIFTCLGRPAPTYRVILPPESQQQALVQLGHFVCTKPRHAPAHVPSTVPFSGIPATDFAPAQSPLVGPQVRRLSSPSLHVPHQSNQFGVCVQVHRTLIPPTDFSNSSQCHSCRFTRGIY